MSETERADYIAALEALEGVQYVNEYAAGHGVHIALRHDADFEVVDEIRSTKPANLELVNWYVTEEHLPAINCHLKDEL